MAIEKELLDRLLAGRDPDEVFARDGLLDDLKKALSERILNAELDEHLESERVEEKANRRNGHSKKSVLTGTSKIALAIPRDRAGTFDPQLIAKYQRRFPNFDAKIVSMYARGMTVLKIRGHLEELYGINVSPDLISAVTDAVLEEVGEWQNRPLDSCYPLIFFDAIRVKIRDEGFVRNKAVYIALGILSGPAHDDHAQLRRHDVEPFADVFADPMKPVAAARAGMVVDVDDHLDAPQRTPLRPPPCGALRSFGRIGTFGLFLACRFDLLSLLQAKEQLVRRGDRKR